jgi:hypothetical protein
VMAVTSACPILKKIERLITHRALIDLHFYLKAIPKPPPGVVNAVKSSTALIARILGGVECRERFNASTLGFR